MVLMNWAYSQSKRGVPKGSDPGPELARPPVPAEQGELARISHCQVASRLANCAEAFL
jgi:hypothetical protein